MQSYSLLNMPNGSTNMGFCIYVSDFHLIDECFSCHASQPLLRKLFFSLLFLFFLYFRIFISLWLYQFYSYKGNEWLLITSIKLSSKWRKIIFLSLISLSFWSQFFHRNGQFDTRTIAAVIEKELQTLSSTAIYVEILIFPFISAALRIKHFTMLSIYLSCTRRLSTFVDLWRSPMRSHISIDF